MTLVAETGDLQLWLTRDRRIVEAAQALRYRVFYEELGARADPLTAAVRLDRDRFDAIADHLVVTRRRRDADGRFVAVGCYRLLRRKDAAGAGGLYTAGEFDLRVFDDRPDELMELGRSCVDADSRGGAVMQLLWRGIADYIDMHGIGVMIGCASLPGTDLAALRPMLAYLKRGFLAPPELRPRALAHLRQPLPDCPETGAAMGAVKAGLPPLLKAYLRMGGLIGDGAVCDHQFNTTDVCLVLPTDRLKARYVRYSRQHRETVAAAA